MMRHRYRYLVLAAVAPLALMGLKCRPANSVEWTGTVNVTRTFNNARQNSSTFNGSDTVVYTQTRDQNHPNVIWSNVAASTDEIETLDGPVTCPVRGSDSPVPGSNKFSVVHYKIDQPINDGGFTVTESSDHLEVTAQNPTAVHRTIQYGDCPDGLYADDTTLRAVDFAIPGTDGGHGVVDLCLQPSPPAGCGIPGFTHTVAYDLHRSITP